MRKLITITLIQIIPILLFCQDDGFAIDDLSWLPYCIDRTDSVEKPIELDWVDTDVKILTEKINPLVNAGNSVAAIQSIIPHFFDGKCNCRSATQDLDFGLQLSQHHIYGGYGSYTIEILYSEDKVLKLSVTLNNYPEIIKEYLIPEIKLPFKCQKGLIKYEIVYKDNLQSYRKSKDDLFIEAESLTSARGTAISYFYNIYEKGEFSTPYYFTYGLGSKTFDYLRYFIVNQDIEALESILFSPSPTSRLLAARTLQYMEDKYTYSPSKKVATRIKYSIEKSEIIRSGILSCWIGKFEYDYYDVVNNFEQYLKEF